MDERSYRDEIDALRSLIEHADAICSAAEITRRRIEYQMRRPPVWPDRRKPRHWERPRNDTDDADAVAPSAESAR